MFKALILLILLLLLDLEMPPIYATVVECYVPDTCTACYHCLSNSFSFGFSSCTLLHNKHTKCDIWMPKAIKVTSQSAGKHAWDDLDLKVYPPLCCFTIERWSLILTTWKPWGRVKRMHKPELKYAAPFGIHVSPIVILIVINFLLLHNSFIFIPAEIFWFLFNFILLLPPLFKILFSIYSHDPTFPVCSFK